MGRFVLRATDLQICCSFYLHVLTLILIALFPSSAAEQNEINPKNEEKLFERQRVFFFAD